MAAKIITVISTSIVKLRRIVKYMGFGKAAATSKQALPYGIDSSPIKDSRGICVDTAKYGYSYITGYVDQENKAATGEIRVFSTSATGTQMAYIWAKSTGTIELNGAIHNPVRYLPLDTALQAESGLINTNLGAILANLTQLNVAVGVLVPGSITAPYVITPVTINITAAKIDDIKTS